MRAHYSLVSIFLYGLRVSRGGRLQLVSGYHYSYVPMVFFRSNFYQFQLDSQLFIIPSYEATQRFKEVVTGIQS
jgi:hypothetical protein